MYFKSTKFFLITSIAFLISCGGGGGGSSDSLPSQSGNASNSNQSSSQTSSESLIVGRVIDGYIEGANVFIDFNWNLQQDEGEPSAVTNSDGKYEFTSGNGEFNAITDVSRSCAMKRPQIVEVPVGATDSDRGVVEEEFTLYLVPGGISDGVTNNPTIYGNLTNISPFTGIFLDFITEAKNELGINEIAVADGCGDQANSMADSVINKVRDFSRTILDTYNLTIDDLYSDYIELNLDEWAQRAARIVDFIKVINGLKADVKAQLSDIYAEDDEPNISISPEALELIVTSNEEIYFLPFSLNIGQTGPPLQDGWSATAIITGQELKIHNSGVIVQNSCTDNNLVGCDAFPLTFDNLKGNSKNYLAYFGHKNETIIPEVEISSQYREELLDGESGRECNFESQLIFDEYPDFTCNEQSCPTRIEYQHQIQHNIGAEELSSCPAVTADQIVRVEFNQKNQNYGGLAGANDIYGQTYHVLQSGSDVISDPPIEFLGQNRGNFDYVDEYNKLTTLRRPISEVATIKNLLSNNEFYSLNRTTYEEDQSAGVRFDFNISKTSDGEFNESCLESNWNGSSFDEVTRTEGENAFSACFDYINAFNFFGN